MEDNNTGRRTILAVIIGFVVLVAVVVSLVLVASSHKRTQETQQQLAQQQKDLSASTFADPLLKYLPYGGEGYNITPAQKTINNKTVLSLTVTITLSNADYNSPPDVMQESINSREQAALDYIRSKGYDPAKYNIEFVVPTR